jgi:hypothetical protein
VFDGVDVLGSDETGDAFCCALGTEVPSGGCAPEGFLVGGCSDDVVCGELQPGEGAGAFGCGVVVLFGFCVWFVPGLSTFSYLSVSGGGVWSMK